jgi:mono/diheme cytochrome c family protein
MKRLLKWVGLLILGLAVLVLALYQFGSARIGRASVVGSPVNVIADEAALTRGAYLVNAVSACIDCHGPNLEGKPFIDEPALGYLAAPNLTSGVGGVGTTYTQADWELAIRHGVAADGRALGGMPSDQFAHLSDADMTAMIAYLESVPAMDHELPARSISLMGTLVFGVLDYASLPVAKIDHAAVGGPALQEGVTAAYGDYLVTIAVCRDCHGPDLEGRSLADAETGPPAGPNLTPGGDLQSWTEADFMRAIRRGEAPGRRRLSTEMPWATYGRMTDADLQAIWLYLQSLPPR